MQNVCPTKRLQQVVCNIFLFNQHHTTTPTMSHQLDVIVEQVRGVIRTSNLAMHVKKAILEEPKSIETSKLLKELSSTPHVAIPDIVVFYEHDLRDFQARDNWSRDFWVRVRLARQRTLSTLKDAIFWYVGYEP